MVITIHNNKLSSVHKEMSLNKVSSFQAFGNHWHRLDSDIPQQYNIVHTRLTISLHFENLDLNSVDEITLDTSHW